MSLPTWEHIVLTFQKATKANPYMTKPVITCQYTDHYGLHGGKCLYNTDALYCLGNVIQYLKCDSSVLFNIYYSLLHTAYYFFILIVVLDSVTEIIETGVGLSRLVLDPFYVSFSSPVCCLNPPKTIISYLNHQASAVSSRRFSILMWFKSCQFKLILSHSSTRWHKRDLNVVLTNCDRSFVTEHKWQVLICVFLSKYCVRMVALMSIQVNTVNYVLSEGEENIECVSIIDLCISYANNVNQTTKEKQRFTYCSWLSSFCSFNNYFCVFTSYSNRTFFISTARYCLFRSFLFLYLMISLRVQPPIGWNLRTTPGVESVECHIVAVASMSGWTNNLTNAIPNNI